MIKNTKDIIMNHVYLLNILELPLQQAVSDQ